MTFKIKSAVDLINLSDASYYPESVVGRLGQVRFLVTEETEAKGFMVLYQFGPHAVPCSTCKCVRSSVLTLLDCASFDSSLIMFSHVPTS